jgi:ParB family chromosome partitioning protein
MVMSLVENLARRQHRAIDLLHDIESLKQRAITTQPSLEKLA